MLGRLVAGFSAALLLASGAAAKPLVVILADPAGAEAPDLLTPYAILAESGAVEVKLVSPTAAPVRLTPGTAWVAPQMTLAQLARESPKGPDVVIVPALKVVDDPARSAWLRAQVGAGARVMSICNGAKVLAAAGLLDGRHATVHWFSRGRLVRKYPKVIWQDGLRWVSDGPVTTTTGISAAEPASLHLLAQLAGQPVMRQTARRLGLPAPDPAHASGDYRLTLRGAGLVVANILSVWRRENVAVPLTPGFDELAFGAAMDGWSRTYLSKAWAVGAPGVASRRGLLVYPNRTLPARFARRVALPTANVQEQTFRQIGAAYGESTARFVALQFEHPYGAVNAW